MSVCPSAQPWHQSVFAPSLHPQNNEPVPLVSKQVVNLVLLIKFQVTIVESGLRRPEGLACDWVNNKIYWTDSETKRIEVTSLDPDPNQSIRARKVLFWENIDLPRAIVVAPNEGLLFW